jgi:hypothetical protein
MKDTHPSSFISDGRIERSLAAMSWYDVPSRGGGTNLFSPDSGSTKVGMWCASGAMSCAVESYVGMLLVIGSILAGGSVIATGLVLDFTVEDEDEDCVTEGASIGAGCDDICVAVWVLGEARSSLP